MMDTEIDKILTTCLVMMTDHEPDGWPAIRMRDVTALADEINRLRSRFTKLDAPRYSGAAMLDSVLMERNPEFDAWAKTIPPEYWARYDLSAARIGWEGAMSAKIERIRKMATSLALNSEIGMLRAALTMARDIIESDANTEENSPRLREINAIVSEWENN
jgi:hypothetical protein